MASFQSHQILGHPKALLPDGRRMLEARRCERLKVSWVTFNLPLTGLKTNKRLWGERPAMRQRKPASRKLACESWFDFSTGGNKAKGGASIGTDDFAILSHLQQLGCGELKGRPREVHFSGCINESYSFRCSGGDFFVKVNRQFAASELFEGEAEALTKMAEADAVRVPRPLGVGDLPTSGSYIIMEHLPFQPFGMMQEASQKALGEGLARMHLAPTTSASFGFSKRTRLGIMELDNQWSTSWPEFFIQQRLQERLQRVCKKLGEENSKELRSMEPPLLARAEFVLANSNVTPSMLHGDLWVGNAGMLRTGQVAIFDPAGFIGHSEFDLAFQGWTPSRGFPGFSEAFYEAYHEVLPKAPGFDERQQLYQLLHLLNHLLIYGEEYYSHTMNMVKGVLQR